MGFDKVYDKGSVYEKRVKTVKLFYKGVYRKEDKTIFKEYLEDLNRSYESGKTDR